MSPSNGCTFTHMILVRSLSKIYEATLEVHPFNSKNSKSVHNKEIMTELTFKKKCIETGKKESLLLL